MFFIIHKQCVGFITDSPDSETYVSSLALQVGDICLILKHEAEPDPDTGEFKRGLVLHPKYGLIRIFLDDERGYVL